MSTRRSRSTLADRMRSLTIPQDDRRAPASLRSPRTREAGMTWLPDPIELACCVSEWRDGGWQHERSCPCRHRPAAR